MAFSVPGVSGGGGEEWGDREQNDQRQRQELFHQCQVVGDVSVLSLARSALLQARNAKGHEHSRAPRPAVEEGNGVHVLIAHPAMKVGVLQELDTRDHDACSIRVTPQRCWGFTHEELLGMVEIHDVYVSIHVGQYIHSK